jgi:histidine ammonia-lyase
MQIGVNKLELEDLAKIIFENNTIEISEESIEKVKKSFDFLVSFSTDKIIYGINTGFGPMAQYRIEDSERKQLQLNLIRSHCSGSGKAISEIHSKAVLISRLNTLKLGYSGIHPSAIELMKNMINQEIYPVIYEHGGVGASGDLVQLAHVALALIGEGEVWNKGVIYKAKKCFEKKNLKPLDIHIREGLAIMNGTSAMTGIGIVNLIQAKKLANLSIVLSSMINELLGAYEDHFSLELNSVKLHKGQIDVASKMKKILDDSSMIKHRYEHLYNGKLTQEVFEEKVQEYYSIRCVPQILGAIIDTISTCEEIVINELNSANDNPIIDVATQNVYHGGNFHGDYVALEMDKLKLAITKLSMLMERQLNYLLNDKLNAKLAPFINLGKLGFNFGIQGIQFTATSTVAENQTLSTSSYIHSIPNNNDNQDIVSMGANAALIASKVIENTFEVCSIELIAVLQAIDSLKIQDKLSSFNKDFYNEARAIIPAIIEDKPTFELLRTVKDFLKQKEFNL